MKIKMTSTQNGSIDGIRTSAYLAGSVHDLSDPAGARALAKAFVDAGMAVESPSDKQDAQPEQPATAGFFTPADGALSASIHGDGSGEALPEIEEKSIEAAPENKMLKRPYNRKAK